MARLLRATCAVLSVLLSSGAVLTPSRTQCAGKPTDGPACRDGNHREKRQLSEVISTISSGARLLIEAGVGLLQSVGRLGKEVVGEGDGGLLSLLGSLFTGVSVGLDLVRNVLLAVLGTKDILLGTPSKEELTAQADPLHSS
ncbi:uncharacterized protein LOC144137697 [Haemaphysalis longicornis]